MPRKRPDVPRRPSRIYLREWLEHIPMTAEQLAARLLTSKSVISKLETGEQRWHQDWLEEVAFVFGCEVKDLYSPPSQAPINRLAERMFSDISTNTPRSPDSGKT